jgi:MSHA biogenesis protein MshQ
MNNFLNGANFVNSMEEEYYFQRDIIINASKIAGDFQDFPMLFIYNDLSLKSCMPDGSDIYFFDQSGFIHLDSEIDYFNVETGELVAWVKIPELSSTDDVVISISYGSNENMYTENSKSVWSNGYTSVWHFSEPPIFDGILLDSVSDHHGIPLNMENTDISDSPIGSMYSFDGTEERVELGEIDDFKTQTGTISSWIKMPGTNWSHNVIFAGGSTITNTEYFFCSVAPDGDPNSSLYFYDPDNRGYFKNDYNGEEWAYFVWQSNGTNWIGFYNGERVYDFYVEDGVNNGNWFGDNSINRFDIGALGRQLWYGWFNGHIDELSLSANVVRSDEWIRTEFSNQNNPDTFYTISKLQIITRNDPTSTTSTSNTSTSIPNLTNFGGYLPFSLALNLLLVNRKRKRR